MLYYYTVTHNCTLKMSDSMLTAVKIEQFHCFPYDVTFFIIIFVDNLSMEYQYLLLSRSDCWTVGKKEKTCLEAANL